MKFSCGSTKIFTKLFHPVFPIAIVNVADYRSASEVTIKDLTRLAE